MKIHMLCSHAEVSSAEGNSGEMGNNNELVVLHKMDKEILNFFL